VTRSAAHPQQPNRTRARPNRFGAFSLVRRAVDSSLLLSQAPFGRYFRKAEGLLNRWSTYGPSRTGIKATARQVTRVKCRVLPVRLIRVTRGCFSHRKNIASARRKNTEQRTRPKLSGRRCESIFMLIVCCTELNQLQRQALSSAIEPLRNLNIAGEAFMMQINKRPKSLRQVGCWN
jgi:hypothetical protein